MFSYGTNGCINACMLEILHYFFSVVLQDVVKGEHITPPAGQKREQCTLSHYQDVEEWLVEEGRHHCSVFDWTCVGVSCVCVCVLGDGCLGQRENNGKAANHRPRISTATHARPRISLERTSVLIHINMYVCLHGVCINWHEMTRKVHFTTQTSMSTS